jgi:two-component system response regulator AtoC
VRELENVIDQAAIMTQNTFIGAEDLPSYLSSFSKSASTLSRSPLDEVVRAHIEGILLQCSGNRSKAAIELGISRRALIRKIEKHNIA